MILEPEQRRELLLIQLLDADTDIVIKYEVQKNLLLVVEASADDDLGAGQRSMM